MDRILVFTHFQTI